MGNTSVISYSGNTFVEQIKVDLKSSQKLMGIFLNPREFPYSGLIAVTNKCIYFIKIAIINYSPTQGSMVCIYYPPANIIHVEHNRKAKDGSSLALILEDNKIIIILSENLIVIKNFNFYSNIL